MLTLRPVEPADAAAWLSMRRELWPDGTESEHREEIARFFAGGAREPQAVFVALDPTGTAVGFTELSIRTYAEGCATDRVAYLEGWFVAPHARRRGVGRALVAAAEGWGRELGCMEFASDTEPENERSAAAHRALGFREVGLVRCFAKRLVR